MSLIAVKKTSEKIEVACDGITRCGYKVVDEDAIKIFKVSDNLIIGSIGLSHQKYMLKDFVETKLKQFETIEKPHQGIPWMKKFKEYVEETYGYTEEFIVEEFGQILIANKNLIATYQFHKGGITHNHDTDTQFAIGTSDEYTTALLDSGYYDVEEAIKKTSEKYYPTVNGKITRLEIMF